VIGGSVTWTAEGTRTLVLRSTGSGRRLMRRKAALPLVVNASFSTRGVVLSAAKKTRLVRDWITPDEARRAATRTLRRSYGAGARNPSVEIGPRCGSACLEVRAEWVSRGASWSARGRARQASGRVSANLAEAVRQKR
jgi:hypothetical protein